MTSRLVAAHSFHALPERLERGLQGIMLFGLFWLIAGMAVVSQLGHVYEYVAILTLFFPALVLAILRPHSTRSLWRRPSAKWVALLLAWSMLSLLWSDGGDAANWIGRCLGILLFLYGWIQVFKGREQRIHWLLFGCAAVMTLAAIAFALLSQTAAFHSQLIYLGGRLMGVGVLSHPNLVAAAMSAAIIWLCTCPCEKLWQHIARAVMVVVLLAFVCMTFSRSAWGALFLALVVMAALHGGHGRRWVLASLVLLGVAALVAFLPEFIERGWSGRPAILRAAWEMFLRHPWLGVGQGTEVLLDLGSFVAAHAHNIFGQIAVQLGLPGLLVWLGIWLSLGWQGWLHRHEPLGRLVLATWVFTSFMGQLDLPYLINSPSVEWLLAWLPLAISYSLNFRDSSSEAM